LYQLTFVITFILISLLACSRASRVKTAADFSLADRSLPAAGVSWIIIGTLVGGVSTVGTVQTAYTYGISACIFTFGSGISCFLLGCFFAKALREEGVVTVSEYLGNYFGKRFQYYSSTFNSAGMFIHVVGQFLASIAILQSVFHFGDISSVLITTLLIGIFVVSGGISGAGLIGKIKFFMLYIIMIASALLALNKGGGASEILAHLPVDSGMFNFSDYGVKAASIDMLSMLVGVLSTQIYLQAIFSAKDVREARNGAFLSAALIPPIGVFGIIIGLYLRAYFPELAANSAQALPFFLHHSFPAPVAALFSAGILLIVLGTAAGLLLGVTTNLYNDFPLKNTLLLQSIQPVRLLRGTTFLVLISAALLVLSGLDSTILSWSYMSMGLRGSAVFAGLVILVFMKRWHRSRLILLALYSLPLIYIGLNVFK
jgi:SSS family solute:Na+ symporter